MFVCVYSVFVLSCISSGLATADHSSKESYQLSISVRLRNLIRGGLGPTWAGEPLNNNNNKSNYQSKPHIRLITCDNMYILLSVQSGMCPSRHRHQGSHSISYKLLPPFQLIIIYFLHIRSYKFSQ
jgi:hypothetical protein